VDRHRLRVVFRGGKTFSHGLGPSPNRSSVLACQLLLGAGVVGGRAITAGWSCGGGEHKFAAKRHV